MKSLSCHEVTGLMCGYLAKGLTTKNVTSAFINHKKTHHPKLYTKGEEDDEKKIIELSKFIQEVKNNRKRLY